MIGACSSGGSLLQRFADVEQLRLSERRRLRRWMAGETLLLWRLSFPHHGHCRAKAEEN